MSGNSTNIYRELSLAQGRQHAQLENQAREARSMHTLESTGVGALIEPEPLMFPNPFVFKPAVSYGAEILTPIPDPEVWQLPRLSGAVMRWELNDRGFFLGAYVYVAVDISAVVGASPTEQPNLRVDHHFAFSSLSYKELGEKVRDQLQEPTIEPRSVRL